MHVDDVEYTVTPDTAWPHITAEQLTALDRLADTFDGDDWSISIRLPHALVTATPATACTSCGAP